MAKTYEDKHKQVKDWNITEEMERNWKETWYNIPPNIIQIIMQRQPKKNKKPDYVQRQNIKICYHFWTWKQMVQWDEDILQHKWCK